MTLRSAVIGCLVGLCIAGLGYCNDWVFNLPYIASDLMPIVVFGLLVVGLAGINPLLSFFTRRSFTQKEWATMFGLALVCCIIPGPGLLWQFTGFLVWPVQTQQVSPGFQATADHPALLSYLPSIMLVNDAQPDARAISGFSQGLYHRGAMLSPRDVPWQAWLRPMSFYLPLIALGFTASICLALILHRQWADREHLRYPIAAVAGELMQTDGEGRFNPIFRDPLFWLGFGVAGSVLLYNGLCVYFPSLPPIPLRLDLAGAAAGKFPIVDQVPFGYELLAPAVYFMVVGLAYLISSEISLSIGLGHFIFVMVFFLLYQLGVRVVDAGGFHDPNSAGFLTSQYFGAGLGCGIIVLYAGRNYFKALLRRTVGLATSEQVEPYAVWASRIMTLCLAGIVCLLHFALGMDWLMATLLLLLLGLSFLIVARVNVETGLLFFQPSWSVLAVFTGMFGIHALGPKVLFIVGMLSLVLAVDQRVALLPLAANALWVADRQKTSLPKLGTCMSLLLVIALVAGVGVTIWVQYDMGGKASYSWAQAESGLMLGTLKQSVDKLVAEDALASAGQATGWGGLQRFAEIKPSGTFLACSGAGLALVLLFYAARLRWTWWPLHPVLFLVWGSFVDAKLWGSFLVGWLAKTLITRFSGGTGYRRARPFFMGLIGGEVVVGLIWMIVGAIYFFHMGRAAMMIRSHP